MIALTDWYPPPLSMWKCVPSSRNFFWLFSEHGVVWSPFGHFRFMEILDSLDKVRSWDLAQTKAWGEWSNMTCLVFLISIWLLRYARKKILPKFLENLEFLKSWISWIYENFGQIFFRAYLNNQMEIKKTKHVMFDNSPQAFVWARSFVFGLTLSRNPESPWNENAQTVTTQLHVLKITRKNSWMTAHTFTKI